MVIADEDATEKVIIKLNTSHSPKSFRLDGERPRLVFDFFDVRYLFNKATIKGADGNIVAGVRAGRHRDPIKTRVVIDIEPGSQYDYEQTFNVSNNSLEITFYPGFPENQNGSVQRQIHVAKPKIVHDTAPVEEKPAVSPEKQEPEKIEETQASASQSEDSQSITVLPADVKKQRVPEADTPEVPEVETPEVPEVDTPEVPEVSENITGKEDGESSAEADKSTIAESDEKTQTDQGAPVILDVSFEKSINNSETVLFKLSHFYPPLVFGIEKGEPRVVCDFHDAEIGADVPFEIEAGGKYVNRITVANLTDPDKVRVELQLVPNHHYDLQQLFFKEDNLFVVIVNELEGSTPTAN